MGVSTVEPFPLPYIDDDEYIVQFDNMDYGMYTMYVNYYGAGCVNGEIIVQAAGAIWEEQWQIETPTPTPHPHAPCAA